MPAHDISIIQHGRTGRASSWDTTGRNMDAWIIPAGESRILADIPGPGKLTHIWMTQRSQYREVLLRITWDNAAHPSVLCPLGDFFGLGHGMVASYQSLLFTASTRWPNQFNKGCALNCYIPMPFRERAVVELVNEGPKDHRQFFYIDYEQTEVPAEAGYFHAEFRRVNPFGGWAPEIPSNRPGFELSNVVNEGETAWRDNYVILETKGRGHYLGCNLSVTNLQKDWWGEGDDMIWVDGYKWPPDIHGTGMEDYLNQAWGMQDNAFLKHGSSIFEGNNITEKTDAPWNYGGYQTSYVYHVDNPVRFEHEIKVTIEHGHANHLANEMSSTAYWYADKPTRVIDPPPVARRMPILRDENGNWITDPANQIPGQPAELNDERREMKRRWATEFGGETPPGASD
jgi:hypothetical protein